MRTASDFDAYYADTDPWPISGARSRDDALRRNVARFVTGEKVLEPRALQGCKLTFGLGKRADWLVKPPCSSKR